jgi:hypothetical protein
VVVENFFASTSNGKGDRDILDRHKKSGEQSLCISESVDFLDEHDDCNIEEKEMEIL